LLVVIYSAELLARLANGDAAMKNNGKVDSVMLMVTCSV